MHSIMQVAESTESIQESVSSLDGISHDDNDAAPSPEQFSSPQRPLRIYTRPQLLLLSQSPMVKLPPDMPELKVWFGSVSFRFHLPSLALLFSIPALRMKIS